MIFSFRSFPRFAPGDSSNRTIGGIDRTLRILIGLALIAGAATNTIGMWGYLGVVPLLTGLIGWCPPYAIFGFNTCSLKK